MGVELGSEIDDRETLASCAHPESAPKSCSPRPTPAYTQVTGRESAALAVELDNRTHGASQTSEWSAPYVRSRQPSRKAGDRKADDSQIDKP
jgi:hypothetical protein